LKPRALDSSNAALFVPGRLCLFGEHSDWAGSFRNGDPSIAPGACIITGTDQGITATAAAASDFEMVSHLPDGSVRGPFHVVMDGAALRHAAQAGGFFSYAAGVVVELWERCHSPGVHISVDRMDLPLSRGLSSSAAVCVLTARAFNQVHQLGLSVRDEMELAYRGEVAAGSQCGRMDQACAYGKRLVLLGFDGDAMTVQLLSSPQPLYLLIVDLLHHKDTRRILADLHTHFLAPDTARASGLREALGRRNLDVIAAATTALTDGDAQQLGALMIEAQSLFDRDVAPACPSELTAPRLHALLTDSRVRELTWGGKGVGSQGDGAAQFVCRGSEQRDVLINHLSARGTMQCLPLTITAGS
jgi:mevalonate kinase